MARRRRQEGTDSIRFKKLILAAVLLAFLWLAWDFGLIKAVAELVLSPLRPGT